MKYKISIRVIQTSIEEYEIEAKNREEAEEKYHTGKILRDEYINQEIIIDSIEEI